MLFAAQCEVCHGRSGAGARLGPSLRSISKRESEAKVRDAIEHPTPPMPKLFPGKLDAADVGSIILYLKSL